MTISRLKTQFLNSVCGLYWRGYGTQYGSNHLEEQLDETKIIINLFRKTIIVDISFATSAAASLAEYRKNSYMKMHIKYCKDGLYRDRKPMTGDFSSPQFLLLSIT